jgi:hypothetical protein
MTKANFVILSLVAVIGASIAGIAAYRIATGNSPFEHKRTKAEIDAACQIHLQNAERKANEAVSRRAGEFSSFVDSRKPGAKPFSEDVVSLEGKWNAGKAMLPGMDKDGHRTFIIEKFNEHIFTPVDLANAMKRSIEGGVKDIEGIENELAVSLHKEMSGQPVSTSEIPKIGADFRSTIDTALAASRKDMKLAAGSLVASEVIAQIGTQVLLRLGVQAGILAAGVANSWWSFGGALVIGVAVDAMWDYVTKPAQSIEQEITTELTKLSLNGNGAIRGELTKLVAQRSELWKKTVKEALI